MKEQEFTVEPIILALDTSSKATSIAVARGAQLVKSISSAVAEKRSEKLWTEVGLVLAEVGLSISDVDLFAVCVGPGGFTGLRVGIAAVKGFSAARNKPIVGVTSLEAAAFAARTALPVCAMVNAYKGEVYSQRFSFDHDGVPLPQSAPVVSTLEKVIECVADVNELVFAGDVTDAEAAVAGSGAPRGGERKWAIKRSEHCLAEDVAGLAFLKHVQGELETAESLKACYVRPAEAEIKLSQGLLGTKIKRSMKF